ncbi:MAG: hypothetical protein HKN09_10535 [Saprospiraceae bacterium]|nr:hypothetical protein [Saprospiraceae bacterium]
MKSILFFFILTLPIQSISQNTVGTLLLTDDATEGYTFFSPFSGTDAWMVDNCGNLINHWDRAYRPGLAAYFLDNGLMLRTYKAPLNGPFTSASNAGGIELVDWDNNTVWQYEINTAEWLSHHDAVMMPNGNILTLTWQLVYRDSLVAWGRNPNDIAVENFMWSERIVELEPIGIDDARIVWEWNIYDHYIQDFDSTKANFGVVSEHPELFDINLPDLNSSNSNATRDWNHFNAIDYNPQLDQILISVRNSDEIWILDHSSTTEEAAGHSGGRYGKGGDILYRWGNASAYERAAVSEQKLFGQHGAQWIPAGYPNEGDIIIYNNGNGRPGPDYSTVEILTPSQDSAGFYSIHDTDPFGPEQSEVLYGEDASQRFYSPFLSNAQLLSNGHILINAGSPGDIFEVNIFGNTVWQYHIPLFGDFPATQGQDVFNNSNFRAYKYLPDYSGFDGIDIEAQEPIENNPAPCMSITSIIEINHEQNQIIYNPHDRIVRIPSFSNPFSLYILDISGRKVYSGNQDHIKLSHDLASGIYTIILFQNNSRSERRIFIP